MGYGGLTAAHASMSRAGNIPKMEQIISLGTFIRASLMLFIVFNDIKSPQGFRLEGGFYDMARLETNNHLGCPEL